MVFKFNILIIPDCQRKSLMNAQYLSKAITSPINNDQSRKTSLLSPFMTRDDNFLLSSPLIFGRVTPGNPDRQIKESPTNNALHRILMTTNTFENNPNFGTFQLQDSPDHQQENNNKNIYTKRYFHKNPELISLTDHSKPDRQLKLEPTHTMEHFKLYKNTSVPKRNDNNFEDPFHTQKFSKFHQRKFSPVSNYYDKSPTHQHFKTKSNNFLSNSYPENKNMLPYIQNKTFTSQKLESNLFKRI